MTKKDYEKFAAMFRECFRWLDGVERGNAKANGKDTAMSLLEETADIFARDSSRFDRERFYAASKPTN